MNTIDAKMLDELVAEVRAAGALVRIAGEFRTPEATPSRTLEIRSPLSGEIVGEPTLAGVADADAAGASAERAFGVWAETAAEDRAGQLRAIAEDLSVASESQEWPQLISEETGKRLPEAKAELKLSATYFSTFAELIMEQQRELRHELVAGLTHKVHRRPRGVVAVMTPWNFPVSIPARKVAPAVASGCTVVFKPSEIGSVSSMVFAALVDRHLPPGVVNTVLGEPQDISEPWLRRESVQALSFTGSTRVGKLVAASSTPRFLPSVLELGGCAPFVVLPDADPRHAAETLMVAKFRNNGQSCIAANQIFIAREIADDVLAHLSKSVRQMRVGDPRQETTDLGPMAPAGDPKRLRGLIESAVSHGAKVLAEGGELPEAGHYMEPALLVDVPEDAAVFREEIFGPVAAAQTFSDLNDVLRQHRQTGYGLAGYVCGRDLDQAEQVAGQLTAGIIGVNTGTPNHPRIPFGGLRSSGIGYEGAPAGLEIFQSQHTAAVGAGQ